LDDWSIVIIVDFLCGFALQPYRNQLNGHDQMRPASEQASFNGATAIANVRFGSQAALHSDINPTAASGAKPDVRE